MKATKDIKQLNIIIYILVSTPKQTHL